MRAPVKPAEQSFRSLLVRPLPGPLFAAILTISSLVLACEILIDRWVTKIAPVEPRAAVLANLYDEELYDRRAIVLVGGSALDELSPWELDSEICGAGAPPVLRKLTFGGQTIGMSLSILQNLRAAPGSIVSMHVNYFRMGGAPEALETEVRRAALPLPDTSAQRQLLIKFGRDAEAEPFRLRYYRSFLYSYIEVRLWPLRGAVKEQLSTAPLDPSGWAEVIRNAFRPAPFRPTAVRFSTPEPLAAKRSSLLERLEEETRALSENMDFNLAALSMADQIAKDKGFRLILIDTPHDPALLSDVEGMTKIYKRATDGFKQRGLRHVDLRTGENLDTQNFRDLVHVVTSGRDRFNTRWQRLLTSLSAGICNRKSAGD